MVTHLKIQTRNPKLSKGKDKPGLVSGGAALSLQAIFGEAQQASSRPCYESLGGRPPISPEGSVELQRTETQEQILKGTPSGPDKHVSTCRWKIPEAGDSISTEDRSVLKAHC